MPVPIGLQRYRQVLCQKIKLDARSARRWLQQWRERHHHGHVVHRLPGRPLVWVGIAIGLLAVGYVFFLPNVFHKFVGLRDMVKIGISIALIAPLASLVGVPFPVTLSRVARQSAALIPWAWAVNGCASVTGAVLATLLAIHLGFTVVVILAAMFYCIAVSVVPE